MGARARGEAGAGGGRRGGEARGPAAVLRVGVAPAGSSPPRAGPGQVQQVATWGSAGDMDEKNEGAKRTASPQLE